jgi:S1-C subfamily serine protease
MRGMAIGGLVLEDLGDEERTRRDLARDTMALNVKFVGQYGKHAAAQKAGFKKGDIILMMDGLTKRTTESQLLGYLLAKRQPGEKVKANVLRETQRVELEMPIQ